VKISQSISVSPESTAGVLSEVRPVAYSSVALGGDLFSTFWRNNTTDYCVRLEQAPSAAFSFVLGAVSPKRSRGAMRVPAIPPRQWVERETR